MSGFAAIVSKFFKNILTEVDGESHDIMRILLLLGSIGMLVMAAISVVKSGAFNATEFGAGYGGLMAAGGVGMGARATGEKKPEVKND